MSKADAKKRDDEIDRHLDDLLEVKAIAALCNVHVTLVYQRMWERRLHKVYVTSEEKAALRAMRQCVSS